MLPIARETPTTPGKKRVIRQAVLVWIIPETETKKEYEVSA